MTTAKSKTPAKKAVQKKRVIRKPRTNTLSAKKATPPRKPAKSVAKPSTRKAPAKKAPAKKVTAKKSTRARVRKPVEVQPKPLKAKYHVNANYGPYGYKVGSDMAIIAEVMVAGGADRQDVSEKALKALPQQTTRSGTPKNISSLISAMLRRFQEEGYVVESHWRLVPPVAVQKKIAESVDPEAVDGD